MENPSVIRKIPICAMNAICAVNFLHYVRGRTDMETGTDRRAIQAAIARIQVFSFIFIYDTCMYVEYTL